MGVDSAVSGKIEIGEDLASRRNDDNFLRFSFFEFHELDEGLPIDGEVFVSHELKLLSWR
jgi:hypothetical protein